MKPNHKMSKGQVIVLFAIGLVALLAVAALVLDGGQTYMHRREAQKAADAGALAGAYELCRGNPVDAALVTAELYAREKNGVTSADVAIDLNTNDVVVTTHITQPSFLAQLLGFNSTDITAMAAAGCYTPSSLTSVLPVAYACRPPEGGSTSESQVCSFESYEWGFFKEWIKTFDPKQVAQDNLFIVMDSDKLDGDLSLLCQPNGTIDCDIDDDGRFDAQGGNRSWIDLNGAANDTKMSEWICDGFADPLYIHTWFPGKEGGTTSLYGYIESCIIDENKVSFLPVYNAPTCDGNTGYLPDDPECQDPVHLHPFELVPPTVERIVWKNGTAKSYFHIINFAVFYATCSGRGTQCPGMAEFMAQNPALHLNSVKSFEGYFIKGYQVEGSAGGLCENNLGACLTSLSR